MAFLHQTKDENPKPSDLRISIQCNMSGSTLTGRTIDQSSV